MNCPSTESVCKNNCSPSRETLLPYSTRIQNTLHELWKTNESSTACNPATACCSPLGSKGYSSLVRGIEKREEFPGMERSIETFANVQQLFKKQNRPKSKENRNRKRVIKDIGSPLSKQRKSTHLEKEVQK